MKGFCIEIMGRFLVGFLAAGWPAKAPADGKAVRSKNFRSTELLSGKTTIF